MYKTLNAASLGISGRLNELIELALTYKFQGLDVDIEALQQQVQKRGQDYALRFLDSADIIVSSIDLPINVDADDVAYNESIKGLDGIAELATSMNCNCCVSNIVPYTDERAYHEQFELLRERYAQIADLLGERNIKLALTFSAAASEREGRGSQFVATADAYLTLVKTIGHDNIGFCLDAWNWQLGGGTLELLQSDMPPEKVFVLRLADLPEDADQAKTTIEERLLPGATGVVPAYEIIEWLKSADYQGPLAAYPHPNQFEGDTRNQVVEQTANALKQVLAPPQPEEPESSETEEAASAK